MSKEGGEEGEEPKILFTSDQNKSCSECQQDVRNIFFAMSICQNATFQQILVRKSLRTAKEPALV